MVVLLALAAAFCFAAAVVLQQRAASTTGARLRLLIRPLWLAGIAVDTSGFLLQTVALHFGAVVTVQALLVASLPFGTLLGRQRRDRRGWLDIALIAGGLAVVLLAAGPRAGHERSGALPIAVAAVTVLATAAAATRRAVPQALGAAFCFAMTATLAAQIGDQVAAGTLLSPLRHPHAYLLAASSMAGLTLQQRAFATGSLATNLTFLTLGDPLASLVLGTTVAGDHLHGGGRAVLAAAAAVVVALAVRDLGRRRVLPPPDDDTQPDSAPHAVHAAAG